MIMTRPQFIYLLPIYLLFWILKFFLDKKEKKQVFTGIISCAICIVVLLIYCGMMKYQHGEFSLSAVSYINDTVTAVYSDLYKRADNQNMIAIVDEAVKESNDGTTAFQALNDLRAEYEIDEIKEFASQSLKKDSEYVDYLMNKTIGLSNESIGASGYIANKEGYQDINYSILGNLVLPINFAFVYIMIIVAIVYLLWKLIKFKKIDWLVAFCTALIFANLFTLIVGAPFEPQRLFLPSIVPVLLLIGFVLSNVKSNELENEERVIVKNGEKQRK